VSTEPLKEGEEFVAARIRINAATELRVTSQVLNGKRLLHLREYFLNDENQYAPTAKGIAVGIDKLPDVLQAVNDLRASGNEEGVHATVAASRGNEIRFGITSWQGKTKADIRIHYDGPDGQKLPTRKGIRINLTLLPEIERALEALDRGVNRR
jgi:hypothetical protein